MRGLYITHEGISNTIFRSQVLEHGIQMKKFDINFDVLVYNGYPKLKNLSKKNSKKYLKIFPGKLDLKLGPFILIPFSYLYYMFSLVFELARRDKYDFIHARTDYSAFVAICTKFIHGLPVVWDCRGDALDEIRLTRKTKSIFKRILSLHLILRQKFFIIFNKKYSDKIITVSTSLKKRLGIESESKKVLIVPCSVPENHFMFNKTYRELVRLELGLCEDDVLFVYSGSMIGYQSINRLLNFSITNVEMGYHILILTKDIEQYKSKYEKLFPIKGVHVKSVEYEDIYKYYSAADIGLILRDDTPTNKVASPTKFGEYCMTGLKVIHNNTVDQVTELTYQLGNGVEPDLLTYHSYDETQRITVSEDAKKIFGRNASNQSYVSLYKSL